MSVVSFRDVSYRVGGRLVLNHFSVDVEAGETLALLGRSGSGKTTALRTVNAMVLPTSGEVLVDQRPTSAWDPIRLRRRIGYVIQDGGLFPITPWLTMSRLSRGCSDGRRPMSAPASPNS